MKNLEWILFHLAQQCLSSTHQAELTIKLVDLFYDMLQQMEWHTCKPKSVTEVYLIGSEIVAHMVKHAKNHDEAFNHVQRHVTLSVSSQSMWHCLWIGYQLRNQWVTIYGISLQ